MINDAYQLSLRATLNGEQIVNVLAFNIPTSVEPDATSWLGVANAIKDAFRSQQVDDLAYTDWVALKVRGAGVTYNTTKPFRVSTVSFSGAFTGTLTGALTGTPAAPNACVVAALNTAQSGRRRKGRIYFAGITEALIPDTGIIASADITILNGMFMNLINAFGPSGTNANFRLGVWSDRIAKNTALSNTWPRVETSQGAPDPDNAWAQVTSITTRSYVGSQRDRRPGM